MLLPIYVGHCKFMNLAQWSKLLNNHQNPISFVSFSHATVWLVAKFIFQTFISNIRSAELALPPGPDKGCAALHARIGSFDQGRPFNPLTPPLSRSAPVHGFVKTMLKRKSSGPASPELASTRNSPGRSFETHLRSTAQGPQQSVTFCGFFRALEAFQIDGRSFCAVLMTATDAGL